LYSFEKYSVALAEHLVEHKLTHWDVVVRQLAAKVGGWVMCIDGVW
jgi:hypothetical protein